MYLSFSDFSQAVRARIAANASQQTSPESAALAALPPNATPEDTTGVLAAVTQGTDAEEARGYVQQAIQMLNVSPEGFMALLQTQVQREDEKVLESRNAIESAIAQSREISERMRVLQEIHQRISQEGDGDLLMTKGQITFNGRVMSIATAVLNYDLVDELNLSQQAGAGEPGWVAGVKLRVDSVQSAIDGLRQTQQTVTSANELNMISMQQAMQQRGQHLQLVSKVLAMMGDTERAIVGNMR